MFYKNVTPLELYLCRSNVDDDACGDAPVMLIYLRSGLWVVTGKRARESLGLGCLFRQSLAKYVDGRADRRTERCRNLGNCSV